MNYLTGRTNIILKKPQYNLNIDIIHSNDWADTSTGKKKVILAKKSEFAMVFFGAAFEASFRIYWITDF